MGEIWKKIQLKQDNPASLFSESIFASGAYNLDVIVLPSDDEVTNNNEKSWNVVYYGSQDNPIIPLINSYSSYSHPFISKNYKYWIQNLYAYVKADTMLTADKLPYLALVGTF